MISRAVFNWVRKATPQQLKELRKLLDEAETLIAEQHEEWKRLNNQYTKY